MPRPLDELHHHYAQALAHRAKRCAQRASRLPLARPGVNNQQSFFFWHWFSFRPIGELKSADSDRKRQDDGNQIDQSGVESKSFPARDEDLCTLYSSLFCSGLPQLFAELCLSGSGIQGFLRGGWWLSRTR